MQRKYRQVATLVMACILSVAAPLQAQINKLGAAFRVNSMLDTNAREPLVVGVQDGFVVVWNSSGSGIFGQTFNVAGEPVGPEFAIGDSTWNLQAITTDAQGRLLVGYSQWVGEQRRLFIQRVNAMGESLGNPIPIGDSNGYLPAIVQDLTGGFGVFWIQGSSEEDPQYRLYGEWFSSEAVPRANPLVITQGNMYCDPWEGCWDPVSGPSAARDREGNIVLAWSENEGVHGLRFNPDGQVQGSRFEIGEGWGEPSIEFRNNGDFQVVWMQLVEGGQIEDNHHVIYGRQFSPLGVPLTDTVLIQSSEPCSTLEPRVGAQRNGGFMVVWYEQCDRSARPVMARELNYRGEPIGDVVELSRSLTQNYSPALSRFPTGDFIAVWEEWNTGIYGQRLQALPDPAAINAGHSDAWYDPQTPGQGFFITVLPESGKIFLAWFTFDTERPPAGLTATLGDPGHRWLTALGDYSGTSAVLEVTLTSGGVFDAPDPAVTNSSSYGTITLEFSGCNELQLVYDLPSVTRSGVIGLQRISGEDFTLCEVLSRR